MDNIIMLRLQAGNDLDDGDFLTVGGIATSWRLGFALILPVGFLMARSNRQS